MTNRIRRRAEVLTAVLGISLLAAIAGCRQPAKQGEAGSVGAKTGQAAGQISGDAVLRIGYQKGTVLNVLRIRGDLERALAPLGTKVQWLDFPAGPQTLEALGTGNVDFSSMGDAPPIFAQAAGIPVVYVGDQPLTKDAGRALLVPPNSAIHSVADLCGKRVAVQKGSGTHSFLIQALQQAGVAYKDVHVVYLAPADARAAFASGSVDAWAIWDPFLAVAQKQMKAKIIADGSISHTAGGFFVSTRDYAVKHADVLRVALAESDKTSVWIAAHPHDAAVILSPNLGVDVPTLEEVEKRAPGGAGATRFVGYRPLDDNLWATQQEVADNFFSIGLLPKKVNVRDGALTAEQYAALSPYAGAAPLQTASTVAK